MALETATASLTAIAPPNIFTHRRHNGLRFTSPSLQRVLLKLRSLSIKANQADSLPTMSWSFQINSDIHCTSKAESCKFTLRAAIGSSSDAKEGKTAGQLAKPSRPQMSMKDKNPKRLSSSASQRIVLDYIKIFKYPLISDLAMREMIENNTLTFIVDKQADKANIKAAANKMLKIRTRKVNTLMMTDGNKKAYLMLKPEHTAVEIAKKIRII